MSGSTVSSGNFLSVSIATSVSLVGDTLTSSDSWNSSTFIQALLLSLFRVDVEAVQLFDSTVLVSV